MSVATCACRGRRSRGGGRSDKSQVRRLILLGLRILSHPSVRMSPRARRRPLDAAHLITASQPPYGKLITNPGRGVTHPPLSTRGLLLIAVWGETMNFRPNMLSKSLIWGRNSQRRRLPWLIDGVLRFEFGERTRASSPSLRGHSYDEGPIASDHPIRRGAEPISSRFTRRSGQSRKPSALYAR